MPFNFKPFQVEDLARAAMHDGVILSWEQGLGKTTAAFAWPLVKKARRTLLVVPEGLHEQFRDTARRFFGLRLTTLESIEQIDAFALNHLPAKDAPPEFFLTTYQDLGQNGADEWPPTMEKDGSIHYNETVLRSRMAHPLMQRILTTEAASDVLNGAGPRDPLVIAKPYFAGIGEEFNGIRCVMTPCLARVLKLHGSFDCVVVDEGTRLQANDSNISLGVRMLDPKFRLVLTGTPIKNRLESLFWLAQWACGGHEEATARWPYAGTSEAREEFANQHLQHDRFLTREAEALENSPKKTRSYKIEKRTARVTNIHRLWKLLTPVIVRRRKDECGEDIVPKIIKPILIRPGTTQQEVYEFHLRNPPIASKGGKEVEHRTALGMQLNLLRQSALCPDAPALGEVITKDGPIIGGVRKSHTAWNPKLAAIMSILADRLNEGEQVIVGSPFQHFSAMLHGHLRQAGVSSVLLDGNTSAKVRGQRAADFKRKAYSVMVAGLKAMGEGHSFECCSHLIVPSLSFAYDENEQFVHRVWRINSGKPVTIYTMVMENSIDEKLAQLFSEKGDSAQLALDGRLFADKVEEVDLSALLAGAVRSFNAHAPTIEERDIAAQWDEHLCIRLNRAETRFREWHPPIVGQEVSQGDVRDAVAALSLPSPSPFAAALMRQRAAGPKTDWRAIVKQLNKK